MRFSLGVSTILATCVKLAHAAHVTRDLDTTFKVKRSKVKVTGAGVYCGGLSHRIVTMGVGTGWTGVMHMSTPVTLIARGCSYRN